MATQLNPPTIVNTGGDFGILESVSKCLTPKLDKLAGKKILFSSEDKTLVPAEGWGTKPSSYSTSTITTFRSISENALVAAIDSSSIKLAETEEGALYAMKAAVAMASGGAALVHFKIGPMLFYLSESTIFDSELDDRLARLVVVDSDAALRLVRVRTERAIQNELSNQLRNSLILIDGSLRSSIFEDRSRTIAKIAENCTLNKNAIVGISKNTRLKLLERAAAPLSKVPGPAYIDVDVIIKSLVRGSIGNNLMAKFEKNSPVLRVDVIGDNKDKVLGRLVGNDPIAHGYPETLRLAHHISTFTNTEVTCLRSHVLNTYDVTELAADDIRHTLLGSITV